MFFPPNLLNVGWFWLALADAAWRQSLTGSQAWPQEILHASTCSLLTLWLHHGNKPKLTCWSTRPDVTSQGQLTCYLKTRLADWSYWLIHLWTKKSCCLPNEDHDYCSTVPSTHAAHASLYSSTKIFKELCVLTTMETQKVRRLHSNWYFNF